MIHWFWAPLLTISLFALFNSPLATAQDSDPRVKKVRKAPPAPPRRGQATKTKTQPQRDQTKTKNTNAHSGSKQRNHKHSQPSHRVEIQATQKPQPKPQVIVTEPSKKQQRHKASPSPQIKAQKTSGTKSETKKGKAQKAVSSQTAKAQSAKNQKRQPSHQFKAGLHTFKEACTMRIQPQDSSSAAGEIAKGKKLWVDAHTSQWHKVYKKSGAVYISADCLQ